MINGISYIIILPLTFLLSRRVMGTRQFLIRLNAVTVNVELLLDVYRELSMWVGDTFRIRRSSFQDVKGVGFVGQAYTRNIDKVIPSGHSTLRVFIFTSTVVFGRALSFGAESSVC